MRNVGRFTYTWTKLKEGVSLVPLNALDRFSPEQMSSFIAAIERVIRSGRFIMGPEVEAFESSLSQYVGASCAVGVGNGTDALTIALRSLEFTPGDVVAVAPNAGGYATTAILNANLIPAYIDISEDSPNMSPEHLEEFLDQGTQVKCVIFTHLYGNTTNIQKIGQLCKSKGIYLIEDCAQSFGAQVGEKKVGSFGDLATFSFFPTKNLGGFGDGGAIVASDEKIGRNCRKIAQYGWELKYRVEMGSGVNSRLDEIQASILNTKLKFVQGENHLRLEILKRYSNLITSKHAKAYLVCDESNSGHLAVIRHNKRDQIRSYLESLGVKTDIHYPVLDYEQKAWSRLNFMKTNCPNAFKHSLEILTLPLFPSMTESEILDVENALSACAQEFGF